MVSSYFSHLHSHPVDGWPELAHHRNELAEMDQQMGLLLEIQTCRKQQFKEMEDWNYEDARVMEWKMEDMVREPGAALAGILRFLGFDIPAHTPSGTRVRHILNWTAALAWHARFGKRHGLVREPGGPLPDVHVSQRLLNRILHRHRFFAKSDGRKPGEVDISSHYRSGNPGDWKNHLEGMHLDAFRNLYPHLLSKLGYENTRPEVKDPDP